MSIARAFRRAAPALILAAGLSFGSPAVAQPVLNALTAIHPGQWQLTVAGEKPRAMCVSNPEALFQIRHRANACSRLVIADGKSSATVHYSCPGAGWGRTTLRVSTPDSVRISTQGIADNAPFDFEGVARRTGECASRTASR
jgi:D-tyrosyl-tRNA(Tyr) deacylase